MIFADFYRGKTVLVTGHTGFKGSWLTAWLLKLGARVVGVSKDVPTVPSMFQELGLAGAIRHVVADIRDLESMRSLVGEVQPDVVFHLAAQAIVSRSYGDPVETMSTNIIGTMNILEAMRTLARPCFAVLITSDKCYDNVEWHWGYRETDALGGKDVYSGSKGAAELVIKSYLHSFFQKPLPDPIPLKIEFPTSIPLKIEFPTSKIEFPTSKSSFLPVVGLEGWGTTRVRLRFQPEPSP